jgi:hypothetical protein
MLGKLKRYLLGGYGSYVIPYLGSKSSPKGLGWQRTQPPLDLFQVHGINEKVPRANFLGKFPDPWERIALPAPL